MNAIAIVLVVGATGSIGRHVVDESLAAGYTTRALVREPARAGLPAGVELVVGDVNRPETLAEVVAGVDAIVFTLGSDGQGSRGAVTIDYGGVRNVLTALNGAGPRIALMTSIGVTNRDSSYNWSSHAHDWKRRSERLVRASGLDYTIVRPGWFDYNAAGQQQIVMIQGDTRHSGSPADGAVARRQIARVLVGSLTSAAANRKTFELVTADGAEQADLEPVFAALDADNPASLDDVRDTESQPLEAEPQSVREDLAAWGTTPPQHPPSCRSGSCRSASPLARSPRTHRGRRSRSCPVNGGRPARQQDRRGRRW